MEIKKLLFTEGVLELTREEAFIKVEKFIRKQIKSYVGQYEYDDLYQTGSIAFLKAYNTYDSEKGFKFITYFSMILSNEICMYHRKMKKHNFNISLETVVSEDESLTIGDTIADIQDYEEIAITNILVSDMEYYFAPLSEKERNIVKLSFFDRKTQFEIQEIMGISQSYVSRILLRSIEKMKKLIKKEGIQVANVSKKEQINKYCLEHQTEQRADILKGIIKTFNVTETTAVTYYHDWKKEFMKSKNVIPKPENEAVPEKKEERVREMFVFVEKQKPVPAKEQNQPVVPVAPASAEEEIKEVAEENSLPCEFKLFKPRKLKILMVQGEKNIYDFSEAGVKIVNKESYILTEDLLEEQQAVLKMYHDTWK